MSAANDSASNSRLQSLGQTEAAAGFRDGSSSSGDRAPCPSPESVWQHLEQYFPVEQVNQVGIMSQAPQRGSISSSARKVTPSFQWVRGTLIGKGTYGRVFFALNTTTTRELLTVQQFERSAESQRESLVEALRRTSETIQQFDHPHIVRHLGFEETPSILSIFSEYVPGGSLGSYIRKHGRLDEYVTKSFTSQILSGLEYLHARSFVHKDLRSDNVLIDTSGVCKLSDYAIPEHTERDRNSTAANAFTGRAGSVFYLAPEVIRPNGDVPRVSSKIDIWSLGCVVLEMWTGDRPWHGQQAMDVLLHLYSSTAKCSHLPESFELSAEAEEFRMMCFAVDPDERPTATELRQHAYLELPPDVSFQSAQ
ncbi:kinase-like domain-containing protein [Daedaleopsis nitida]|nr:kinase-like domain-containing protein [Daedaleopsis nitida]